MGRDNLVLVRGMCLNRRGIQCYAYDGAIINMTGELLQDVDDRIVEAFTRKRQGPRSFDLSWRQVRHAFWNLWMLGRFLLRSVQICSRLIHELVFEFCQEHQDYLAM